MAKKKKEILSPELQAQADLIAKLAKLETDTKNWLQTDPMVLAYFQKYNEHSIENFVSAYITQRRSWVEYGPMYAQHNIDKDSKWIDKAWEHMAILQQKKLFDANCLWRANKLKIEEIEIAYDFLLWETNVLNCPFIEPITENDIDMYCQYLNSNNVETEIGWLENYQDYEEIKQAYNDESEHRNFPAWYDFANIHTGNAVLLLLPNTRGEAEKYYIDLCRKQYRQDNPEAFVPSPSAIANKPMLSCYDPQALSQFVNLFETPEIKQYYHEYIRGLYNTNDPMEDPISELLMKIEDLEEPMAIEANANYKEALKIAYEKHCLQKIITFMPQAYQEYLMNNALQISQPKNISYFDSIKDTHRKNIIQGRILNGEEPNLDF